MYIVKQIRGYVEQEYENGKCIAQRFVPEGEVEYLDANGQSFNTISEDLEAMEYPAHLCQPGETTIVLAEKSQDGDVHTRHCCIKHGCKYGQDEECTVVTGLKRQEYYCEYCGELQDW